MSLEESIKNIQESLETVKELTETVSDFGEVIDETVEKVDKVQKKVNEIKSNDAKIKHINSKQDILDKKIDLLGEAIEEYQGELDTVKQSIPDINKPLGEQKTQLKQANLDIKKLEKQKADKEHKHVIDDIEGLPAFLEDIKNKPSLPVSVGGYTKGVRGLVAGTNVTIDNTDPRFPVVSASGGGGGISDGNKGDITVSVGGTQWDLNAGVIEEVNLNASVNASLDLADSALQAGDNVSSLTNDAGYGTGTVTSVAISGSDGLEVDSGSPITTSGTIVLGVNKINMLAHLNVEDGAEVNNISDANATDLTDGGDTTLHTHDGRYYTESEVDTLLLGKLNTSLKGANNGLAELDGTGKVPASQLPSFVDDVVVVPNFVALPGTGETGKIYVTEDTNITYRWNGTGYTEISASLALGETSLTAYRGDRGKIAYDHSQLTSGNPHNVTKTDVGLSNVVNADTTTTANITDSTNKRFVTDAQLTVIGNTSGTNTGDQDLSGLVPYTGASTDVNLGVYMLLAPTRRATTSAGMLIESANGTDIGLFGVGNTANVEWYGSHNFATATQDTIAIFTGTGKTLGSASTATYPSLTELSYVKGVTSAIQTQLNAKLNLSGGTVTGDIALTGADVSLAINTDSTTKQAINIATSKFGIASKFDINGGYAGYFYSDGTATASATNGVLRVRQATSGASGPALVVDNLGTSLSVNVQQSGTTVFAVNPAGSLEIGHASDTTLSRVSAGRLAVEGINIPTISSADTFTNKRITKRVTSETSSATPTINTDNCDVHKITALATDVTSMTTNLSGTPTDWQMLCVSFTGTATRAITRGSSFESSTHTLPTTTDNTNTLDVLFRWNTATSKWRCVGIA